MFCTIVPGNTGSVSGAMVYDHGLSSYGHFMQLSLYLRTSVTAVGVAIATLYWNDGAARSLTLPSLSLLSTGYQAHVLTILSAPNTDVTLDVTLVGVVGSPQFEYAFGWDGAFAIP